MQTCPGKGNFAGYVGVDGVLVGKTDRDTSENNSDHLALKRDEHTGDRRKENQLYGKNNHHWQMEVVMVGYWW